MEWMDEIILPEDKRKEGFMIDGTKYNGYSNMGQIVRSLSSNIRHLEKALEREKLDKEYAKKTLREAMDAISEIINGFSQ